MKLKWWIPLIPGVLFMSWAANSPVLSYPAAIGFGAVGGALIIAAAILLVKERKAQAAAQQRAAENARREADERKAAAVREQEERKTRQAEWEKTHGRIVTGIAGVTFKNDDGTSRQAVLKDAYVNGCSGTLDFVEYEYQGEPALLVCYEGLGIGNVPKARVEEVLKALPQMTSASLDVQVFAPDANDEAAKPEKIYRADLTIIYNKTAPV